VIVCFASVVHLQVKEVTLQMQTNDVDCNMTKEPRACESSASGGATPAGLHWPNSGAAPPPTHSMGKEGSRPTELDPTHSPRPEGQKRSPGDYNKVSTVERADQDKRQGREVQQLSSHYLPSPLLLHCCSFLPVHLRTSPFVVHMFPGDDGHFKR